MELKDITIYIKAQQNTEVTKRRVTIGDIAEVECANPHLLARLKLLTVLRIPDRKKQRYVLSVLCIIEKIHEKYPDLKVECLGTSDLIVTYEEVKEQNRFLQGIKVTLVTIVTFVGAAFSIMTFNNDVDIPKLFSQVYEQVMGTPQSGFSVLEISYSIGIAVGILIFFNHFGKKRFSVDPTPIEVEMRKYENEIQNALIQKYEREGNEKSANETNSFGGHRS